MSNEQKSDGGSVGLHPIVGLPDGWHSEPSVYDPDITHVVWPDHGAASIHWRRRSVASGWCIPRPVFKENMPRGRRWRAELVEAAIKLLRDAWPNSE